MIKEFIGEDGSLGLEKNAIYHSPMGDEIEHICINCGKSKEIDFLYY